jgi:hypothetical protein
MLPDPLQHTGWPLTQGKFCLRGPALPTSGGGWRPSLGASMTGCWTERAEAERPCSEQGEEPSSGSLRLTGESQGQRGKTQGGSCWNVHSGL